ncbi:MAG: PAS domain S-box protein [Geobacter sp.]|nr:PAS domain S-box protein [Geobacter sp.]
MFQTKNSKRLSTRTILFRVLLVIFVLESVNELFAIFGPYKSVQYHLLESLMLVLSSGPVIWFTIARPLKRYSEEQVVAESEKNRLLSLMESTLESTADGIVVFDKDMNISIYNRQYCKMWRVPESLAEKKSANCINDSIRSKLINPDEFNGHTCHLFDCPTSVYHDVLHLKDGRVIERDCTPQSVDGEVVGRVSCYRDITERVQAQKAIAESESRFRQIFEQSADAIFLLDPVSMSVIDLNKVAVNMFNYEKNELLNRPPDFLFSPEECRAMCEQTVQGDIDLGYWVDILRARRKDGGEMFISVRCRRIELADQQVLLCTIRDISGRVRAEEENRAIESKLIQANKMTSLGVLVAGIAHEINNPNNYIMVSSEILSKAWNDVKPILTEHQQLHGDFDMGGVSFDIMQHEIPELLDNITDGSRRIKNIVNGLKEFAREGRKGMREDLDLNKVIHLATVMINHQIRRFTNQFIVETDPDLPLVTGNSQQIEQVLINLILNALQSLSGTECQVRLASYYDAATRMVCIEVSDQGCGIDDDISGKILDPFFTTRLDKGGTGLGLSISNSIISDHKGTLSFRSSPAGTTFFICIPVSRTHNNEVLQNAQ